MDISSHYRSKAERVHRALTFYTAKYRKNGGLEMWLTKLAFAILVAGSLSVVSTAQAQWYISGNVGAAMLSDADTIVTVPGVGLATGEVEFDTGFGITGAVGYSMGAIRLEGEVSYRENDVKGVSGVDVSSLGFMANAWYDFDTGSKWVPFVGGGIGVSQLNLDYTSADDSKTLFAYQLGAGLGYEVTPKVTVNLSYRLFGTGDPKFTFPDGTVESEYMSHNIMAGVLVKF
jgi:opacity protein-like surface antigen